MAVDIEPGEVVHWTEGRDLTVTNRRIIHRGHADILIHTIGSVD
jgi:hypothetical protein